MRTIRFFVHSNLIHQMIASCGRFLGQGGRDETTQRNQGWWQSRFLTSLLNIVALLYKTSPSATFYLHSVKLLAPFSVLLIWGSQVFTKRYKKRLLEKDKKQANNMKRPCNDILENTS